VHEDPRRRGQGLLIVAVSAVVAGVLLIAAGLATMNSFTCRPGQSGSLAVDAGGTVSSHCPRTANSPLLFVVGFALLFVALAAASWWFRARQAPPPELPPDELG
jgi:hypothetical protein